MAEKNKARSTTSEWKDFLAKPKEKIQSGIKSVTAKLLKLSCLQETLHTFK